MEDQFQRTESLIGDIAVKKLLRSKVIVFGIGGVGGYVCEALARAGIGKPRDRRQRSDRQDQYKQADISPSQHCRKT